MKNSIKFCLATMLLFSISCSNEPITEAVNDSQDFNNLTSRATHQSSDVYDPISNYPNLDVVGTSTLVRNKNGITVNFMTTNLIPGHAYTLWWIIWNNPQYCAVPGECNDPDFGNAEAVGVDVLFAAGHVADEDGVGTFSGHLRVDGAKGAFSSLGLEDGNAFSAEVHLVLRSHGPAIPGMVNEQISTVGGGCDVELGIFVAIPEEVGECGDIEFAIHSPVN